MRLANYIQFHSFISAYWLPVTHLPLLHVLLDQSHSRLDHEGFIYMQLINFSSFRSITSAELTPYLIDSLLYSCESFINWICFSLAFCTTCFIAFSRFKKTKCGTQMTHYFEP